jgi:hypothetical protein
MQNTTSNQNGKIKRGYFCSFAINSALKFLINEDNKCRNKLSEKYLLYCVKNTVKEFNNKNN